MAREEWRSIYSGDYEVSSAGRVRRAAPGRRTHTGRQLGLILQRIGYYSVRPVVGGKNVHRYVHELVAECFIGARPAGSSINHRDGVKTNNRVGNLEYVTHAENMAHAARLGLSARGSRHGASKLSESDVIAMRAMSQAGASLSVVCTRFSVAKSTASQIINKKSWRHVE